MKLKYDILKNNNYYLISNLNSLSIIPSFKMFRTTNKIANYFCIILQISSSGNCMP